MSEDIQAVNPSGLVVPLTTDVNGNLNINLANGTITGGNAAASATGGNVPASADYIGAKNSSGKLTGLLVDSNGYLEVNVAAGTISGGNAAASATGSAVPSSADYVGFNSSGNLVGVSSSNPLPITITNSSVAVTGTFWQTTQPVSIAAATSGGCSTNVQQALTTSSQVKSSAGQLYAYKVFNPNGTPVYLSFYNTTSAPTIGSTTNLIFQTGVQAGVADSQEIVLGVVFSSGIYVAVATTATGNTAPGTGVVVTTIYK